MAAIGNPSIGGWFSLAGALSGFIIFGVYRFGRQVGARQERARWEPLVETIRNRPDGRLDR